MHGRSTLILHFMRYSFLRVVAVLAVLIFGLSHSGDARVVPQRYGVAFGTVDSVAIGQAAKASMDSLLSTGIKTHSSVSYDIQHLRPYRNLTPDFYVLAGLCIVLGLIRYGDPRYFTMLAGAYRGIGGGRQWRDLLQAAALMNLAMNIFFCAVAGSYIYYISSGTAARMMSSAHAPFVLPVLIAGMMLIYTGKYLVIRFSGWVFRVEGLASDYLFNVFLVNKIISIVLLPFVIIIAFAGREWVQPMAILSGVMILGLLATRYLRSWSAFYAFFKGSRFHFFTYLCASEILPMAVLVKWLLRIIF
jgi:hypothetical protein